MNEEKLIQASNDDLILINLVEDSVRNTVAHAIKEIDMCRCNKCQLGACAIALNALPTKYITTTKGALLAEIGMIKSTLLFEVVVQASKALKIIKERPLH